MPDINTEIRVNGKPFVIKLDSNKSLNPYSWSPPIIWEGSINAKPVKFTQNDRFAILESDFNFEIFPAEFGETKLELLKAIDFVIKRRMN